MSAHRADPATTDAPIFEALCFERWTAEVEEAAE